MILPLKPKPPEKRERKQDLICKIITQKCPKCNSQKLYKYGKDKIGNQKYQCQICKHQFAERGKRKASNRKYLSCPLCGKASFSHHDYEDYFNYRCGDKKFNHSFFQPKPTVKIPASMSHLFRRCDFNRMRHNLHLVITVLTLFYIGGSSFRKISLMLKMLYNVNVSHVTIGDWCKNSLQSFIVKFFLLCRL
jgi:DNA-directed RNA polymerase subunit RPC12/RpoP